MIRKLAVFGVSLCLPVVLLCGCMYGTGCEATENKKLVQAVVDAYQARDLDLLDDVIAADYVRHCQSTPDVKVNSLEDLKVFLQADIDMTPDGEIELVHMVAEGAMVSFWAVYRGTPQGMYGPFETTGESVELDFAGTHRIADGKIVETWVIWDNLTALTQLGVFPPKMDDDAEE
jgi:predicted ester cyclase